MTKNTPTIDWERLAEKWNKDHGYHGNISAVFQWFKNEIGQELNRFKEADYSHAHNNRESEKHFAENIAVFKGQVKLIYDLLKSGEKLTCGSALLEHNIGHLPRRIADLRHIHGVDVKDRFVNKHKEYFLEL